MEIKKGRRTERTGGTERVRGIQRVRGGEERGEQTREQRREGIEYVRRVKIDVSG